ncbi:UNVERIFIED_CONTAM: hypothetical protein K2H54_044835 [Gekko kuhli]
MTSPPIIRRMEEGTWKGRLCQGSPVQLPHRQAVDSAAESSSPTPSMGLAVLLPLLFRALTSLLVPSTARPVAANASAAPTVLVTVDVLPPKCNLCYLWAWLCVGPTLNLSLEALEPELRHVSLAVCTVFSSTKEDNGT